MVSIAPFSTSDCPDCSRACFRFLIFHPFSRGVTLPHLPRCSDARGEIVRVVLTSCIFGVLFDSDKKKIANVKVSLAYIRRLRQADRRMPPPVRRTHAHTNGRTSRKHNASGPELSMGWVDPTHGLTHGLGRDFSVLVGWVHYSKSTNDLKGLF